MDIDWDDVLEAFVGALLAGLVIAFLAPRFFSRGHRFGWPFD